MDKMENVQLITITVIKNSTLKVELVYDIAKENKTRKPNIYFKDEENKRYEGTYYYGDSIKVLFYIPIVHTKLSLILENEGIIHNVQWVDNKNESIVKLPNEYKIFTKNSVITLLENGSIHIEKRKLGDKLKYEINKQKTAKKQIGKLCLLRMFKAKEKYYLFNDRILYGDDNAEQLFNYINANHKKMAKKCYFVLDKNADCIKELKKVGKVLKYGSIKHKLKYLNAKMVISSHASYYDRVFNPFTQEEMDFYKDILCKKFVFLQHGVIMNDVHMFLQRPRIIADLFVTTTNEECKNIQGPSYMYEEEMVACTGLPRFDKLVDERKKVILISPTWRAYLTNVEYTDDKANDFSTSEYFQKYASLLQNEELLSYLKNKGYEIKFLLHPAFQEYKDYFLELNNENVKVILTKDIKYSDLFKECSIFITDYSSIHFDVAFLKKPIIYYQFDKEKFFQSHYQKGYYDYEKDGYGEVIEEEKKIIDKIKYYLNNNCKAEEKYIKKIEEAFCNLDRNNSKRVYEQILKLEEKQERIYRFNNVI